MTPPRVDSQELVVLLTRPFLGMTVRDSSLVTLKEPQDYDPALGAKWERNGDAASSSAWVAGPPDEWCAPTSARSPSA